MACTSMSPEGSFFVDGGFVIREVRTRRPSAKETEKDTEDLDFFQTIVIFLDPSGPKRRLP